MKSAEEFVRLAERELEDSNVGPISVRDRRVARAAVYAELAKVAQAQPCESRVTR